MITTQSLMDTMHVEKLDELLFRGDSVQLGLPRVFGGQVVGQALNAAYRTVEPHLRPHSLHSYFLRPGDASRPIIYDVDPIRDGRSFCTRRVVAKQGGQAIFNASVSFQKIEEGVSHQFDLPDGVPDPDDLENDWRQAEAMVKRVGNLTLEQFRSYYLLFEPSMIDMRSPHFGRGLLPGTHEPVNGFWFKFNGDIGDDPIIHRTLLSFISDKALMSTALLPHEVNFETHRIIGASLDHAMWFHTEIRVDDWVYYHLDSPRSARARGFNRGSFYTRAGELICSTAQEGLIRVVGPKDKA